MKPRDFCYWLKGFTELQDKQITAEQWKIVHQHLVLVKDVVIEKSNLNQVEKTILMLWGFVQLVNDTPSSEQWNRIITMVNAAFENISKEVEVNSAEESPDLNKILEEWDQEAENLKKSLAELFWQNDAANW